MSFHRASPPSALNTLWLVSMLLLLPLLILPMQAHSANWWSLSLDTHQGVVSAIAAAGSSWIAIMRG